ncbi:MAG: hypothetical protein QOI35_1596, partial [Cryptosporangiaceae bacterium]|nr:hypothetical protein [Cryptosporangiaceae bacterium]
MDGAHTIWTAAASPRSACRETGPGRQNGTHFRWGPPLERWLT